VKNSIAYYHTELISAQKRFIAQAPGSTFYFLIPVNAFKGFER
jgi:hypothetical protein